MQIGIAPTLSVELIRHHEVIVSITSDLNEMIGGKEYGPDIQELYIGVTSISPQFEPFFKPTPPKYIKGKKSYEYDVRLEFEALKNAEELAVKGLVAKGILSSMNLFTRFSNFDHDRFNSDLTHLFKSRGWI